jgi:hypothetical protein
MKGTKAGGVMLGVGLSLAIAVLAAVCLLRWRVRRACLILHPGRVL